MYKKSPIKRNENPANRPLAAEFLPLRKDATGARCLKGDFLAADRLPGRGGLQLQRSGYPCRFCKIAHGKAAAFLGAADAGLYFLQLPVHPGKLFSQERARC